MAIDKTQTRKPTHDICQVKDRGEGKKAHWTNIGAAWTHEDGQGLNIVLDFVPVNFDGRLVIRTRKDDAQSEVK